MVARSYTSTIKSFEIHYLPFKTQKLLVKQKFYEHTTIFVYTEIDDEQLIMFIYTLYIIEQLATSAVEIAAYKQFSVVLKLKNVR